MHPLLQHHPLQGMTRLAAGALALSLLLGATSTRVLWAPAHACAQAARAVDFRLEAARGGTKAFSDFRGRVVVMFYADRSHSEDNQQLKRVLSRYVKANALAHRLAVLPVANLRGYNYVPAKGFARAALRRMARKLGVTVLADWKGALQEPPLSLQHHASNVLILDESGNVLYRAVGDVTGVEREKFFTTIRRALATGTWASKEQDAFEETEPST